MSDLDTIKREMWEVERDDQRGVAGIRMHYVTKSRLMLDGKWEWSIPTPTNHFLFGIPVLLDPSMQPNEIKLVADCGCTVRLVNLG